ncbi:MAG: GNAT family N-acetyltransferase [Paracoccaceae bacterium]
MSFELQQNRLCAELARSDQDMESAFSLRYQVFISELGGDGRGVDHVHQLEQDMFDAHADHLILRDKQNNAVVATTRLMRPEHVVQTGGYYSDTEYDLNPLLHTGRNLLEIGRTCVHRDFRNTGALLHLWAGLAAYVDMHGSEILFGVASLKGTDIPRLAAPLSLLHHRHAAAQSLQPRARIHQPMDLIAETDLDRKAAMIALPPLIKSYLRMGGQVGDGAFVDHQFNCTDICMVMDTAQLSKKAVRRYGAGFTL